MSLSESIHRVRVVFDLMAFLLEIIVRGMTAYPGAGGGPDPRPLVPDPFYVYSSRRTRFRILPVGVRGMASVKTTLLGILNFPILP